ncbi:hypothetical protein AVEN_224264-1 [Araneus ventricosus]|uniref:Uncharacterized protein n=1 Tax=Araneus ventricosus TaxID=182803 RepID=A0A4Y2JDN4_ARAVE|nr:hypothetical protein AVEN_224264-1 [Araneus ventricosus]
MENKDLFTNIRINTLAQVTGTIALIQISSANRLQLISNNSNSTLGFSSTNIQQISNNDSNNTFNSTQLTGFPACTGDETPESFFKACSLSKTSPPFGCLRVYTLILPVVTSHGIILYILHISSPNRDIEKIIAFSGIFDLSPSFSKSSVVRDCAVDGKPCDVPM